MLCFRVAVCFLTLLFSIVGVSRAQTAEQKLALAPEMIVNESAYGDAALLVDEQELCGDPASGRGRVPATSWTAQFNAWRYPLQAFLDLGARHRITKIFLYDGQGSGEVVVSSGEPFEWKEVFTDKLTNFQKWNEHAANVETRYLRVTIQTPATRLPEIVVYGTPSAAPAKSTFAPPAPRPLPTMGEFIGLNAFVDDPLDKITVAGFVREYHNWNWDEGDLGKSYAGFPNNQNKWNPGYAGGGWNFDEYYEKLHRSGITVCPAVKGSTMWLAGNERAKLENKPVPAGEDAANPASYAEHADHLFQYAARYGSTKVADAKLKLAPDQPRRSGLGLLKYFENWNEPDRWWGGRDAYFSAYELAAMCSADYDGHLKTMGDTCGVKNADPNAKLVIGGLAGLNLDYVKAMKVWADYHRRGSFPADVLNFHHYSNTGGEQQSGKVGISPEADRFKDKMRAIVEYRDLYLPDKEVWVTEFGYDINQNSPQRAPRIGDFPPEEVQAQWLVRSYLALAAAGVDKAAMYMLRDVNPASRTQFDSSGLTTEKGAWKPKPSWFYVSTLRNRLAPMRFAGEQNSGNDNVMIYKFKRASANTGAANNGAANNGAASNGAANNGAYVVWCPTSSGTTVRNYQLKLQGRPTSATVVSLADGDADGVETKLSVTGGAITFILVEVGERPIIILVDNVP